MTTLLKMVERVRRTDKEEGTIYATLPWSCESLAILADYQDTTEPILSGDMRYSYFLEDFVMREFLESYLASLEGRAESAEQVCERLIQYALNDA